ncbi:MAG: hypothetical protein PVF50_10100 [Gammaproteobacteria bacterium]|jgi:hypothetical protein
MRLAEPPPQQTSRPQPQFLDSAAADNLRYIRATIAAAHTFTLVPGRGCMLMGGVAVLAAALETVPALSAQWLPIWLCAAVISAAVALYEMAEKAKRQGLGLRRAAATRFFMTLAPAFAVGAILTAALLNDVPRAVIGGIWLLSYGSGVAACGLFSIPVVVIAGGAFIGLGAVALSAPQSWCVGILALGFGGIHLALGYIVLYKYGD